MNIFKLACRKVGLVRRIESSRPKLYRMAYAWSHDAMLADDLVQETQMLALQKIEQLKDEAAFDGWVYTILNNVWLGYLRKSRPSEDIERIVIADNNTPEHEMLVNQVDLMVRSAMTGLPNAQRQVVSLVDLEGLSYSEVASVLQVPIGTVMSRLNRARSALGKSIKKKRLEQQNKTHVACKAQESNADNILRVVK
ncbi:MAG: sigma-70 family RNA polymerase sigma factor [Gammaproteobacteria bacterium]|nr:sigma-70 family RNA polymerase sigma factor [Gammaproteobacteria bacterium]